MRGDRTKLPVGDDCWGRILGIRPITYLVDWSCQLPSKADVAMLAQMPREPYREYVIKQNVECHYERLADGGAHSLEALRGKHKGETLVLVGAGPSAEGIAKRLEWSRDKCKVMVCNRALQYIDDPDYFYLIEALADPDWWCHADTAKVPVISPIHANVNVAEAFPPENHYYFWLKDSQSYSGQLESLPLVEGACHVGTSALHVAHIMGFSRVLLVGFDFSAFEPKRDMVRKTVCGKFYADGTNTTDSYIRGQNIWIAEDYEGYEVMVTEHFIEHRDAMAICCAIAEDAGMEVWNCAEGGMLDLGRRANLEQMLKGGV